MNETEAFEKSLKTFFEIVIEMQKEQNELLEALSDRLSKLIKSNEKIINNQK